MGSFSITHWLIFLGVVVVVFGTSKLKNVGKDVGSAVKDFKDAVKDESAEQAKNSTQVLEQKKDAISTPVTETQKDKV